MKRTLLSPHLLLGVVALIGASRLTAQQDPYTTHYAFNRMMFNPATAGAGDKFCLSVLSHYQYLGYEDRTLEFHPENPTNPNGPMGEAQKNVGPKTQYFSFSAPVTKYGGLGIAFMNDKLGYEFSTAIKIDGAFRYPISQDATIALGIEANILQKGLDGAKLKPLAPADPSIPTTKVSDSKTIFGAGLYYTNALSNSATFTNLWIGASMLNLNQPTYIYQPPGTLPSLNISTPKPHIYVMGGVDMDNFLGNPDLVFHPSVMIKQNTIIQFDFTALAEYQKKLWGGVAYRTWADAFSIMLGYSGFNGPLRGLRVGYSYDLTMSKILSVSSGTHELQLNYCFIIKIPEPVYIPLVTPPFMHRESNE